MTSTNKVYVIKVMTKREGGGDVKNLLKTDDVFYELPYLVFFPDWTSLLSIRNLFCHVKNKLSQTHPVTIKRYNTHTDLDYFTVLVERSGQIRSISDLIEID